MRIISTKLPRGVIFAGEYYPLNWGHKTWFEFARLVEQEQGAEAAYRALKLCYRDKIPYDWSAALELLCDFFAGGENRSSKEGEKLFSFAEDEALIYASFLSEYGIDLVRQNLHWWQFLSLLGTLGADCALMRVASIRAVKPSQIKDAALRRRVIKQKQIFALENKGEADVGAALSAAFSV